MRLDSRLQRLEAAVGPPEPPVCTKCRGMWINVFLINRPEPEYPCPVCGSPPKQIMHYAVADTPKGREEMMELRETIELMAEFGPVEMRDEWQRRHPKDGEGGME